MPARDDDLSPAGEVFAEFLALRDDGLDVDFEDFCGEHAEFGEELRQLYGRWVSVIEPLGARAGPDAADSRSRGLPLLEDLPTFTEAKPRFDDRGAFARGGMGEIHEVWDRNLRRTLAMKVLLRGKQTQGSRGLVRFLEEAQITGQLDHPGIVPVHELGLDPEGRVFFTMPLIRGRHLGDVFKSVQEGDPDWTLARALGVVQRVCEAVAYAHSKGVLHRDLKPANVMVGPFGETYVMDWGLAKVLASDEVSSVAATSERGPSGAAPAVRTDRSEAVLDTPGSSLLTAEGTVLGTPAYLPPEHATQDSLPTPRADVYSIGAMLYELLAGTKPYTAGGARTADELLRALAAGPPAPVRALRPDVPPELAAVCEKAMAWDPARRYADVMSLSADLRAYLEGRVVQVYESGAFAELRKWIGRNRALAAAIGVAALVALVGLGGVSYSERSRRTEVEAKNRELSAARLEEARQADLAKQRATEVLRLSDIGRLDELERRADELWPAHPDRVPALQAWLSEAEELVRRGASQHRPTLDALRESASPYTAAEQQHDLEQYADYRELEWFRDLLAEREDKLAEFELRAANGDSSDPLQQNIALWRESIDVILGDIEPLEALEFPRLTWTFADAERQWEHDTLADLVRRIDAFAGPEGRLEDARRRVAEAERIDFEGARSEDARSRWADALASIADTQDCPLYAGLELEPQVGLLPLGRHPDTELWEFAHLLSGDVPEWNPATGAIEPNEAMGIVLVLLPGGTTWLGAQSGNPLGRNYDPGAQPDESPPHRLTLEPFFLARYELTQAQYVRCWGTNPADVRPGRGSERVAATLLHPVETVTWTESAETARRLGLVLPTEAQWEYAARAGTSTPWFTGSDIESLAGYFNGRDHKMFASGDLWEGVPHMDWLDDGYAGHAPVGSYLPNPFGLFDVFGNVMEWCADVQCPYQQTPRKGDGLRTNPTVEDHIQRGGSFFDDSFTTRAGSREASHGDYALSSNGMRLARRLDE